MSDVVIFFHVAVVLFVAIKAWFELGAVAAETLTEVVADFRDDC